MTSEPRPQHWLEWRNIAAPLPKDATLVAVHMRELRPVGTGTETEEWLLVEFKASK